MQLHQLTLHVMADEILTCYDFSGQAEVSPLRAEFMKQFPQGPIPLPTGSALRQLNSRASSGLQAPSEKRHS
jgi:hypothetical protein